MKKKIALFGTLALLLNACLSDYTPKANLETAALIPAPEPMAEPQRPTMDVVFCLDATGSMSGLISVAKEKIWAIATSLTQTDPSPQIRIGMVFYRDRGDAFVTRQIDLTTDIDSVYEELMAISAGGGGDAPESVNQALFEAVNALSWSQENSTFKSVFLVGDCPPHMDYQDDVKYFDTCPIANKKGIVINTIKMGNSCTAAVRIFNDIARCTNGSYNELDMDANGLIVSTPYDDSINVYSYKIDSSKTYYGNRTEKNFNYSRKEKAMKFHDNASTTSKTGRAIFNSTKGGKDNNYGKNEFYEDLEAGKVRLDTLQKEHLPEEMKEMNKAEREIYVKEKAEERKAYKKKLVEYEGKREIYLQERLKNKGAEADNSFSSKVFKSVQKQAKEKGIKINGKAKH